jgi:hypothetical protein
MATEYSREGLLAFLREASLAGRLNPATARSRLNAAHQLLAQLADEEAADLRRLDTDQLVARCHKLEGTTVRPEVLRVYQDRLNDALTDYFSFLKDPEAFVAIGRERREPGARPRGAARSDEEQALERVKLGVTDYRDDVIPIPIRNDHVVYVQNLPPDLTDGEARKITRVVNALVDRPEDDA